MRAPKKGEDHSAEIMLYKSARKELQELTGIKKFPPLKDIKAERSEVYEILILNPKIIQIHFIFILCCQAGIHQIPLLGIPFFQSSIIK